MIYFDYFSEYEPHLESENNTLNLTIVRKPLTFANNILIFLTLYDIRTRFEFFVSLVEYIDGLKTSEAMYFLVSAYQWSTTVLGAITRETNFSFYLLCVSFATTTRVYNVLPKPISSHKAAWRLYLIRNPNHLIPSH